MLEKGWYIVMETKLFFSDRQERVYSQHYVRSYDTSRRFLKTLAKRGCAVFCF